MNTAFKRIVSFILTLVMVAGFLPSNVFSVVNSVGADTPNSITATAPKDKIYVGQTMQLDVKDDMNADIDPLELDFASSDPTVAHVDDNGVVTGIHSGNATITVTYNGSTVSDTIDIEVSATLNYALSVKSYNMGVDSDGDGKADIFADKDTVYTTGMPAAKNHYDTWTDRNASKFLPFYVDGSTVPAGVTANESSAVHYRTSSGVNQWTIYPFQFKSAVNTYTYQNPKQTAPWKVKTNLSFSGCSNDIQIMNDQLRYWLTGSSGGYVVLVLDVPAAGSYEVAITLGAYASKQNMDFYLRSADEVTFSDASKYFEELSGNGSLGQVYDAGDGSSHTLTNRFEATKAGEYFFTIGYSSAEGARSFYSGLKNITLRLEEWNQPTLNIDNNLLLVGGTANLSVSQNSSFGNTTLITGAGYAVADNSVVEIQENGDGTAKVTGVAEGAAIVTASYMQDGEPKTIETLIKVSTALDYNIVTGAFNIGNDTDFDGYVDEFNPADLTGLTKNTWYNVNDNDADHYIPFNTTGANVANGLCWARGSVGWMLYATRNSKYLKPAYQNPDKSAPWTWYTSGNLTQGTYLNVSSSYIEYNNIAEGSEPYFVVKLDLSKTGTFNVKVNAGSKRVHNQHYYLIPGSVVDAASTKDRTLWFNEDYYLGNIDTGSSGPYAQTFTSYDKDKQTNSDGVKLEENVYYFVTKIDNDGENDSTTGTFGFFKSVTLILNEMTGIYVESDDIKVEAGKTTVIDALEKWTIGDPRVPSGVVTFGSEDATIADVHPTNGTVTGIKKGSTYITVTMGDFSKKVKVTVMTDEIQSVKVESNMKELPTGDATRLNITDIWSVSGNKPGVLSDYTFESSDEDVAFVDAHGNVLAVGVGEATITATSKIHTGISGAVTIKVVAASTYIPNWLYTYNITTNAFNVGNDTDGDGIVDDFGGKEVTLADGKTIKIPQFVENALTKNRDFYIPYYGSSPDASTESKVEGEYQSDASGRVSLNGGLRYRGRTGQTFLQPIYSDAAFANNQKYFTTYDYQNSAKTAPWQWSTYNTGINASNTYLTQSYTWIYFNGISDGNEPYVTLKLNIPESGEYTVSVDSGVKSGGVNMHFYLLPVSAVTTNDRATLTNPENEYGNIDLTKAVTSGTITATFEKKLQVTAAGEYYLVIKIDNDVSNSSISQGVFAYLKSVTLLKDKLTGLVADPDSISIENGEAEQITVEENWSVSGKKPTSMKVTYKSEDTSIATVDSNGLVMGVNYGQTNIVITMGPVSVKVPVVITRDILTEMTIGNTAVEFEAGKSFTLKLMEKWTVSGDVLGTPSDYTFFSSNQNVATVDVNGIVTGVGRGNVTITATRKDDATITDKIDLYVLTAQPSGEALQITYNFTSNSYNIGNDSNGDGIVDDFGNKMEDANGLLTVLNTWTDQTADYFIPYYATDSNDANSTISGASENGYAHARKREAGLWRLLPIWTDSRYNQNEKYFNQYRYQNGANTGYWQWTKYNSYIDATQTLITNRHTYIRSANKDVEGKEPYVTLKLMVPAAGTYQFSMQTISGGLSKLHIYMIPVENVDDPTRANLLKEEYKVGTIDNRITTTVRTDNAFTADKAGEYYLVIKMDNDNWQAGETGYPTKAEQWDVRLVSVTLTLDKQTGLSATADKDLLRPGGIANISVYDAWKYDGNKYIKDLSTVTFSSDNNAIATVDENGVVTGVGEGIANITISKGEFSTKLAFTVKGNAKMTAIQLTNPQKWVNILRSAQLKVEEIWSFTGKETVLDIPGLIEFSSSAPHIATVDKYGKVTGVSTGKTTITAKHKVSGLTTTLDIEVSGVLEYFFKSTSYNMGNYDEKNEKYDFGDAETTTEQIRNWIESTWNDNDLDYKMNYNTWTDKTADKFVPFYVTDYNGNLTSNTDASWKNGYIWGRARNGMWQFNPFFVKYPKNEYFVNSYEYQNQNNTAPWKWTEFNENFNFDNTYVGNSFTWLEFNSFKDGTEPYVTIKIQVPVAGLYTADVGFTSTHDANLYFYLIPADEVSEVNRDVLTDKYCLGDPLNLAVFSSKKYNGSFNAERPGEYYFVIKIDDDHLEEGKTLTNRYARLTSLTLTPDSYTGIEMKAPTKEIEVGWHVKATVNTTWTAGGKDDIIDLKNEIKFVSSDPSVASIDENGKIVGLKAGTTTITATEISTGSKASINIVVKAKGQGKQDTHIYFTKVDPDKKLSDVTIEEEGWELNYDVSSSYVHTYSSINGSYGLDLCCRSKYQTAAIDVYVRHDGYYQIKLTAVHVQNNTQRADIYVDGTYVGDAIFNGLDYGVSLAGDLRSIYLTTGVHTFNFIPREDSGQSPPANYNYMILQELRLKAVDALPEIKNVEAEELFMSVGAVKVPDIVITTKDNFAYSTTTPREYPTNPYEQKIPYNDSLFKIDYKVVSGSDVVQVNDNGQVVSLKEGTAQIHATINYYDHDGTVIDTREVDIPVLVSTTGEDPKASQLTKVEIVGPWYEQLGAYVLPVYDISLGRSYTYYVRGINGLGEEMKLTDATYSWTIGNTNIVTTEADAESALTLTAKTLGKTKVKLTVTLGEFVASTSFEVEVKEGKTGRTVYTDEMIETARYNISQYDWAVSSRDNAIARAERFIGFKDFSYDTIWDSVTSAGLPRTMTIGQNSDPKNYTCRYCNADLYRDYGLYCYPTDPFNIRWKVICPECDHKFPTNDFGSFYELGRTAENNGKFDRMTALENHRKLLISKGLLSEEAMFLETPGVDGSPQWKMYYGYGVKGGYLYNETCPGAGVASDFKGAFSEWETTEGWGVDDGFGYYTGRNLPNGKPEFYPFAAYYNHIGLWFSPKDYLIVGTITACADAYIYTGDVTYGRIAAILLDRVADVYPEMRTYATPNTEGTLVTNKYVAYYNPTGATLAYDNNDGITNRGHVIGRIWGCLMAEQLPTAYDKVYSLYDDPVVIDFLNDKGHEWGYGDGKDSAAKIRENIEMNILYETYNVTKQGLIHGNFGLTQAVVAGAAAVLDTYPYTQEMINWLYQSNARDNDKYNLTGGDINNRLVNTVWRDGQNYESPYYNEMGISDFSDAAWYLQLYDEFDGDSIYENVKYLQLINSFQTMTQIRRGVNTTGDAGSIFNYVKYPSTAGLREAFQFLKDDERMRPAVIKIAQHLYYLSGGIISDVHYDLFTEDPESYAADLQAFIDEYGEYDYDKSSILTGYGFAYLRDGTLYAKGTRDGQLLDTTRDFAINFSGHWGHNHEDLLDLQMNAFGIPMTGDFGYPEGFTGASGYSNQFLYKPIAHNTVMVDEMGQQRTMDTGKPIHFDANDFRVKVMDIEALGAYSVTDEYRRTVVMIDYNDDISYGIDFFRVAGGDDHLYSFMPASEEQPIVSDNLKKVLITQKGGSYAGPDVPFGDDPNTGKKRLQYPYGYTWIFDIDKALNSGLEEFWMDYQITDFREYSRNDSDDGLEILDARLRVTMLNNFPADEIFLGSVMPQSQKQNDKIDHLEKFFVRHKGYDIDSLFTAVYEPYEEGKKYIASIDSNLLNVTVADGKPGEKDVVKAVRVKIDDGNGISRYDYVIYSSNNNVLYTVTDPERNVTFNCRGFVGVYSTDVNGKNNYTYVNDGDYIGNPNDVESIYTHKDITGKVTDWQRELSATNWIDVSFSKAITEEQVNSLVDRMIDVERSEPGNSCFFIEGVEYKLNADGTVDAARLNIGTVTTISSYVNKFDFTQGYNYDVFEGASFSIKMSYEGGAEADYSALNAELEYFNTLNQSDFSVDSWLRYKIAIDKGFALSKNLKAIDQKIIDDIVAEIQARRAELVSKTKPAKPVRADYKALDEEIAMMDIMDPALYTIESWEAYVAVWQEAVDLDRNLTSEDQQIIDDMVAKLKAAREALVEHSTDYTLIIVLCAAFAVVLIAAIVVIIVVKRRRKLEALETPAEEVPTQE